MEKKNKKITLDTLAEMIGRGFNGVDKRFDQIDKRFLAVDKRFDGMDKKIDQVIKEVNKINLNAVDVVRKEEFNNLEGRVVRLEETANFPSKKS